jgi:hypothetical protein
MHTQSGIDSIAGSWGTERSYVLDRTWTKSFAKPPPPVLNRNVYSEFEALRKNRKHLLEVLPPVAVLVKEPPRDPKQWRSTYMDMTDPSTESVHVKLERTRQILVSPKFLLLSKV